MWCHHCQQDVPAVSSATGAGVNCARCQHSLATPGAVLATQDASRVQTQATTEPAIEVQPWTAADVLGDDTDRLYRIGQTLKATRARTTKQQPVGTAGAKAIPKPAQIPSEEFAAEPVPLDPRIQSRTKQLGGRQSSYRQSTIPAARDNARPSQASAWIAAIIGAIGLGGGLGLLGWSLFGQRPDLWNWGLAVTLGGQGLMIVGLVQLLANLWTGTRVSANKLMTLHYELRRLQRSTDSLTGMHSPSPTAFYADLAKGSSPQVLLSNLKGQLDEVTTKLARE